MIRKVLIGIIAGVVFSVISYGQFADCSTGLLQAPTAEMQDDGTFMITNNFLNQHSLPSSGWDYNTFQYGIYISFWERIEIGYVCTIFNDYWKGSQTREGVWMINQDRHFVGRVCLLKEGEFGLSWMPAFVVGVSDPVSAAGANGVKDYIDFDELASAGNGLFNRNYIALSKHFNTPWGFLGAHVGYQFNKRTDYTINGLCAGINWQPKWLQNKGLLDCLNVIAEYDSRTFNLGLIASLWHNHFEAMLELQKLQWLNFGIRYKLNLK